MMTATNMAMNPSTSRGFPSYRALYESGQLRERAEKARSLLSRCVLCPRVCRVDRLRGELGECRVGRRAMISSFGPHFGEERPLVGRNGSGTIFFAYCNLRCLFCQNYTLSHMGEGKEVDASTIAAMMLSLQQQGCHNINFVSPTQVIAQILEALEIAIPEGLSIPLVYNTGGYDSVAALRLLDGIFDIYMPDMKYGNAQVAETLSGIKSYPRVNRHAVKEMHRQVGDLLTDEAGIARRGLIIRHLVLPAGLAGTEDVLRFIAEELSKNSYVNLMDQYHPCYEAHLHPDLNRPITPQEYRQVLEMARQLGLNRLDHQERRSLPFLHP